MSSYRIGINVAVYKTAGLVKLYLLVIINGIDTIAYLTNELFFRWYRLDIPRKRLLFRVLTHGVVVIWLIFDLDEPNFYLVLR